MRMRPIEQMLVGLSGCNLRDTRPLPAAQASIERVRHLLWHGRPAQADQELVRFADHAENIARSGAEPEQVVARDLLRHCSELRGYVQNSRTSIVSATIAGITVIAQYRHRALRDASTRSPMLAWASAAECGGRHLALIASPSSGLLSLMAGSEPPRASGWRPDRPAFFHSLGLCHSKQQYDSRARMVSINF
jgi:hypothetical protein